MAMHFAYGSGVDGSCSIVREHWYAISIASSDCPVSDPLVATELILGEFVTSCIDGEPLSGCVDVLAELFATLSGDDQRIRDSGQ